MRANEKTRFSIRIAPDANEFPASRVKSLQVRRVLKEAAARLSPDSPPLLQSLLSNEVTRRVEEICRLRERESDLLRAIVARECLRKRAEGGYRHYGGASSPREGESEVTRCSTSRHEAELSGWLGQVKPYRDLPSAKRPACLN